MSASEVPLRAAPLLGQHSADVVAADLGLDGEDLEALFERGIIAKPG
jgi:hypothetical protein